MNTPADSAFIKSQVLLPSEPSAAQVCNLADAPVSDALVLLSLIILIPLLRRIVGLLPSLLASLIRWKESVNLFNSVKLGRDRNMIALALILPFCLIVSRTQLYSPAFMEGYSKDAFLGITAGVFLLYIVVRSLLERLFIPKKRNVPMYWCACRSSYTFFIILTLLLLILYGITSIAGTEKNVVQDAMLWLSATVYTLFVFRKTQIFTSSCSIFTAFLYLCALEILPTGALVASAVIF